MNLAERITLMVKLGEYLIEDSDELQAVKQQAFEKNKWFIEEFSDLSIRNISKNFLDQDKLKDWVNYYHIDDNIIPKKVGVVMAGNIPLVGFHDFLCVFISGHRQLIKLSEKDGVLLKHIIEKLCEWNPEVSNVVAIAELLKDCDAYIATGSNNSVRYFHYYFDKYPSLIRNNKTGVAVLYGNETLDQLSFLANDVHTYFGLGCRNVTKLYVPEKYDFVMLLNAFRKYNYFSDFTKYKNNYDYNLALLIMNNKFYMTNDSIILVENENLFSPVSELHFSFYQNRRTVLDELSVNKNIQCIVSSENTPFGKTQEPRLFEYADGIDTIQFLLSL
ncbi:MAG TPA: acyl-CoA reductase [Hanamia sp.]|nr:acyl-CoA reductase [Hanamia sp.]